MTPENRIRSVDDATRFRKDMVKMTVQRVRDINDKTSERVSLVGWSMGGLYGLDAAQEQPQLVRQVITLGSPFGDPRGTSLFKVMRRLSGSTVPLEAQNFDGWLALAASPAVPTKVIYSARDGIVATRVAKLPDAAHTDHEHVRSSHVAFAINPRALSAVADTLASTKRSGVRVNGADQ